MSEKPLKEWEIPRCGICGKKLDDPTKQTYHTDHFVLESPTGKKTEWDMHFEYHIHCIPELLRQFAANKGKVCP